MKLVNPESWVDEALIDGVLGQTHRRFSEQNQTSDSIKRRVNWLVILFAAMAMLIVVRLAYLQFVEGRALAEAADERRIREERVAANRGVIRDRHGEIIVSNRPEYQLVIIPADLPKEGAAREQTLQMLAEQSSIGLNEINEALGAAADPYQEVIISESLSPENAIKIKTQTEPWAGVKIKNIAVREYRDSDLWSALMGYVGKISAEEYAGNESDYALNDTVGKGGIEKQYETLLHGTDGKQLVEVDSQGSVIRELASQPPLAGADLLLTVDAGLQRQAAVELKQSMSDHGSSRGVLIALNPQNGEILAYLSLPGYDNNRFVPKVDQGYYQELLTDPARPLFNRGIAGLYPPGSTIKPALAAAALQEGIITPSTTIMDRGEITVPNKYDPSIIYHFVGYERSGLGVVDVYNYIARSSDVFSYYIGGGYTPENFEGLGAERMKKYYKLFGLGEATGVDLGGEQEGLIPDPEWKEEKKGEAWYLGDDYHMAIGQGDVLITPLQLVNYVAAVANGGKLWRPHFLTRSANLIREGFIDEDNLTVVQEAMRQTVVSGSGSQLNSLPIEAAGKTGTAQYVEAGIPKEHAWFVSYAPVEQPEIALVVLVEGGGEGHAAAVPVARAVLDWYFKTPRI